MRTLRKRTVRWSIGAVVAAGMPVAALAGGGGVFGLGASPAGATVACVTAGTTGLTAAMVVTSTTTFTNHTVTASGCDVGLYVAPTSKTVTIKSVTVTGANDHGIFVQDATHVTILTSIVKDNGVAPTSSIAENKGIELVGTSNSTVMGNTVTGNTADGGIGVADDGPTKDPGAPTPDTAPHTAKTDTVSTNTVTGNYGGCGIVYAAYNKGATAGISGGTISGNTDTGAPGQFTAHGPVIGGVVVAADTPGAMVSGVTVTGNTITGAAIPGIVVHSNAPGDAVSGITLTNNTLMIDDWLSTDGPPKPAGIIVAASPIPPPAGPTLTGTMVTGNTISQEFYGIWVAGATTTTTSPNTITTTPRGQAVFTVPAAGSGYWMAAKDGGVFSFGSGAHFYGSMGGKTLAAPVVGMAPTLDQGGYWLAAADGGVFTFGDASFYGSMGGKTLAAPIVGIASTPYVAAPPPALPTPAGKGYWLVGADGGVFTFGDAHFYGSMGGKTLASPIVGMAPTPDGKGYWLVGADGGVFSFGDAHYYGSLPQLHVSPAEPIVGMAVTPMGTGYWLVGADGGVFSFGTAKYMGSLPQLHITPAKPIVGISATPMGGYRLIGADGGVFDFGTKFLGSLPQLHITPAMPVSGAATVGVTAAA